MAEFDPYSVLRLADAAHYIIGKHTEEIGKILKCEWYPVVTQNDHNITVQLMAYGSREWHIGASFSMRELPGCCGICVSYHVSVSMGDSYRDRYPNFTHRGLGTLLLKIRMAIAKKAGYTYLQATLISEMPIEEKILRKAEFQEVAKFVSKRTSNTIKVFFRDLYAKEKVSSPEEVAVAA
jgi:hypothetical protein